MDNSQVALVKDSWSRVADRGPVIAVLFRERVARVAPDLDRLLPPDDTVLKLDVMLALTLVTEGLDDIDAVGGRLGAAADVLSRAGLDDGRCERLAAALTWAVEHTSTCAWDGGTQEAWRCARSELIRALTSPQQLTLLR